MNFGSTLALGAIAGSTIVLGLPVGRIRAVGASARVLLSSGAVGVLVFLVWDVLSAAWEPIDAELTGTLHAGRLTGLSILFVVGVTTGLLSVVGYERFLHRRRAAASEAGITSNRSLAVLVAVGIGVHNLAEGLAIGQSAAAGALGLATVLVIGFALHNATEGFGIVAPLAGDPHRPTWRFLLLLGAIGGVPTFVGTAIGWAYSSSVLSVLFLSLAAGSILYVIIQLLAIAGRAHRNDLVAYGLLVGLFAGFATDAIVTLGGA
ncbi:ZIP family metal transporter [Curtobacterium sp. ISL-83]|uniref:ZIP family metal transporter n=1 Tax=Curtobacterium sp. ISL-83 TaxID=2819145 RepID=UPI001BE942A1|nr:ZIP family metal transporter [Curtobacterium sp. ISL-83]MBT2502694.1 ZIP family metal transporter [Curtobacterium sp. ISL-83]